MLIDICDYNDHVVCHVFDSDIDLSGQAHDVFITSERNGWKEVSFELPTKCYNEEGDSVDNYRLDYVIAEYRLRTKENNKVDWFIITKESARHEAYAKNRTVTAGHISQLLKNRALDLEFSDEEGNNVGTVVHFLYTILEAAGWDPKNENATTWRPGKVATFYEDDGVTEKIRSMNAPVKTGAFRLIEQMCELFEAKPVYNGDHTVDILPMNPFSELEPGEIPEAVYPGAEENQKYLTESNVIPLHYDRNVKTLGRERNTENIATRLYAYGSYGDYVSKYCSLQTAKHKEYTFVVPQNYTDTEFEIEDEYGDKRYFKATVQKGQTLIWSMLDYTSRRYVWNDNERVGYKVYETPETKDYVTLSSTAEDVTNYFPYLSDYTYYEKVGLLTDEMFQKVAAFQRDMAQYYQNSIDAQAEMNNLSERLSIVGAPTSGFLKLDVQKCEAKSTGSVITINWDNYPYGVIYRSDYLEAEKNYFQWHVAQSLKANGDPTSGSASILYVIHQDTWESAYLKDIDGRTYTDAEGKVYHDDYDYALSDGEPPKVITIWKNIQIEEGDEVYLLCRNNMTGRFGAKLDAYEGAIETLETYTKKATGLHPTVFIRQNENLPSISFSSHGWCYRYADAYDTSGELYFAWPERNDSQWHNVIFSDTEPDYVSGGYYFNTKYRTLWHGEEKWVKLESVEEKKVAQEFSVVIMQCKNIDMIYQGLYENYYYDAKNLPQGNYAIPTEFGFYWLFTTDQDIQNGTLRLDTVQRHIYQDDDVNHIVTASSYPYDTLIYPEENCLDNVLFAEGSIYIGDERKNGTDMITDRFFRTNYVSIWPNEAYDYRLPEGSFIVLYDANRNYLGYVDNLHEEGSFSTTVDAKYSDVVNPSGYANFKKAEYMKLVVPAENGEAQIDDDSYIHLSGYTNYCFYQDQKYEILSSITHDENEPVGINTLIKQFKELSDELYTEALPRLQDAQQVIKDENAKQVEVLGDIYREGWWQDSSYVEGDEQRMYKDAMDNLRKLSQPEVSYTFDYLHLMGSNPGVSIDDRDIEWPDIEITDAAHLIDPELGVNQWAYIDRIRKCYDQKQKTTIEINTNLTLMGQHDFKDVMARIAEVASETKAKQTIYSRAESINSDGSISADQIQGTIDTQNVSLNGVGWKTDEKGDLIMESGDGMAAMKFCGSGLFIANSKTRDGDWDWQILGNGYGLNANKIVFGEMKGDKIEAKSISVDKLMANVGNLLEIGSNRALALYATVDGAKPSGSLKTTDAIIEIKAGDEETSAQINIGSGGEINLRANNEDGSKANINMYAGSSINLEADSKLNLKSGGEINIAADSSVHIATGGTFTVESGNFQLDEEGDVTLGGEINADEAKLGSWYISNKHIGNAVSKEASSVGLATGEADDVTIWAGSKNRNSAPFKVYTNGAVESSDISITGGSFTLFENRPLNGVDGDELKVANSVMDSHGFRIGRITKKPEDFDDKNAKYNFVVDNEGNVIANSVLIVGGSVKQTEVSGDITSDKVKITGGTISGVTITGSSFDGDIAIGATTLGERVNYFTADDNHGAVITKGSITLGKNGVFSVTNEGKLTAKNATASGVFTINSGSTIGSLAVDVDGKLCNAETKAYLSSNGDYFLWSGDSDPLNANMYITHAGKGKFKNLDIGRYTFSNGSFVTTSTRDAKKDIKPLEHRDAFDQLKPVSFKYKYDTHTHFGLIYEDLKELYPETCFDEDGSKGVSYLDFIAVLIKEVQDLRKRVSELERR